MREPGQLAGRIHASVGRKQFDQVADGVLYPAFGLVAAAAVALSSVSVVTKALRLNRGRL